MSDDSCAKNEWERTFDAVPELIAILDNQHRIVRINRAMADRLGHTAEECVGQFCYHPVHDTDSPPSFCPYVKLLQDGRQHVVEVHIESLDGDFEVSVSPLFDADGQLSGCVHIAHDITQRKRIEAELAEAKQAADAANQAKSRFLAHMSHEIRTPMTSILGYTDLMMTIELSEEERREQLQIIHRSAKSLLMLINDILDLSKIEAEKVSLELSDCSPRQVVDDTLALVRGQAEQKGLNLDAHYDYPLPETIRTDPARLRQILVNLLGNAVKFTEQGSVRITVRCTQPGDGTPRMEFAVSDTGIGLTDEEKSCLFEPFTQADTSTANRFGGTGLGLAISKRLAEILGGKIDVQSRPGHGSTFTLTIDPGSLEDVTMLQLPSAEAECNAHSAETNRCRMFRGRVLLAEDEQNIQVLISLILKKAGLEVELAENGRVACEKAIGSVAEKKPYDLIVMDIQMPELDGYQATKYLREHGWTAPIIALTAHVLTNDRRRCLQAGCDDYIVKPIDRTELLAAVASCLGSRKADLDESQPLGSGILGDGTMSELLDAFIKELSHRAGKITDALQSGDFKALKHFSHQLKGAAGVYGFPQIARAANRVYQCVEDNSDAGQLQSAVDELVELCERA